MRTKLIDAAIRSYEPRPAQYTVGDAACPGLCIRITPKGVKSFAFAYRNKATGKVEWLTIGRYPDVPLTRAREVANDTRKTAANGGTPLAPKAGRAGTERKAKSYGEVVVLPELCPARISVSSSLLAATMNQKSSLGEDPNFVSWVLTANSPKHNGPVWRGSCEQPLSRYPLPLHVVRLSAAKGWPRLASVCGRWDSGERQVQHVG